MKNIFCLFIPFLFVVFSSCATSKGNFSQQPSLQQVEKEKVKPVVLSPDEQRKFDYFFYEGNRFKAIGESNKSFMNYAEALKIDSTCAACNYEIARLLLTGENFEDAEKFLENAVRLSPSNRWYIELLARVYQNNKKGDKAVHTAVKLLNQSSPDVEEIYFVSQLQIENKQYAAAIKNLERIENLLGFNEGLTLEKYQLYLQNEDFKDAEKVLTNLIKTYPGNVDYHLYLGDFYLDRGNSDKALKKYQDAQKLEPHSGKVFFSLANYYLQKSEIDNFKEMIYSAFQSSDLSFDEKFQRFMPFLAKMNDPKNPLDSAAIDKSLNILIKAHPYDPKGYVAYGNFLALGKNNPLALQNYEKALEIDAQQNEVWQDYLFLLSGQNDNERMLEQTRQALTFFPDNPIFHLFEGVSLYQEEKLQDALESFKTGLKNVGENRALEGQFHAYMGDIYYSLKDTDSSFNHYEKALAIDENNLLVLNNYSYYLSLSGQKLDKAEKMSAKTVELDPGNATYLDTYAWVLFKRERYMEAKFIIERAIDNMKEPNGVIMEHYGDILFMNGDKTGALKIWNKALQMEEHSELLNQKIEEERFIDYDEE